MDAALLEVRHAQRVLVAFYQRVKDIVLVMREELGVKPCYWGTKQFPMPGNCGYDLLQLQRSSWESLPMADASFEHTPDGCWGHQDDISLWLQIRLVTDDVFIENGPGYDPSPLNMPPVETSQTYLEITVCQIRRFEGDGLGVHWTETLNRLPNMLERPYGVEHISGEPWQTYRQRFQFSQLCDKSSVKEQMTALKLQLSSHDFVGFDDDRQKHKTRQIIPR
ncbi:hypothetical protein L9G15_18105 [Shewanella sp. A3A]|nr:hypothetical protein [Shewanella ferrihydritica]